MGRMTEDWYRGEARRRYEQPRKDVAEPAAEVRGHADVETADDGPSGPGLFADEKPLVSTGTQPGAWVMLWVWVPDPPPEEPESGKGENQQSAAGGPANGG